MEHSEPKKERAPEEAVEILFQGGYLTASQAFEFLKRIAEKQNATHASIGGVLQTPDTAEKKSKYSPEQVGQIKHDLFASRLENWQIDGVDEETLQQFRSGSAIPPDRLLDLIREAVAREMDRQRRKS